MTEKVNEAQHQGQKIGSQHGGKSIEVHAGDLGSSSG